MVPAEKLPNRIMHKKNTAVNGQSTTKNMSKMHAIAEDTRERMKSLKVAKDSRSDCNDCCTSQSSKIISELRQKKDERSEKLAKHNPTKL